MPREIDPQALDEYLTYQYVPHPDGRSSAAFRKLPPGHYAVYRDGRLGGPAVLAARFQCRDAHRPRRRRSSELRETLDVGRRACGCRARCRWGRFCPAASIPR